MLSFVGEHLQLSGDAFEEGRSAQKNQTFAYCVFLRTFFWIEPQFCLELCD